MLDACQRAVGGLATAFCSGPVLAQWPEHRLSFGNQRGDLDFKEIQKKAGGRKQASSLCSPGGLGVRRSATQGSGWGRVGAPCPPMGVRTSSMYNVHELRVLLDASSFQPILVLVLCLFRSTRRLSLSIPCSFSAKSNVNVG